MFIAKHNNYSNINNYVITSLIIIIITILLQAWKGLNHRTGCDLKHIVKILTDSTIINQDVREKAVRFVTQHLDKFLCTREKPKEGFMNKMANSVCIGKKYICLIV